MLKTLKISEKATKRLMLTGVVILIMASFVNNLPMRLTYKKLPTDYFKIVHRLPYVEADKFTVITYESDIFDYFSVLKFYKQSDINQFIDELKLDKLAVEHEVVNGVAPALNLFEEVTVNGLSKLDLLPFDLKCGCFRYITYNLGMLDGGYLYLILIYEDLMIIDYMPR